MAYNRQRLTKYSDEDILDLLKTLGSSAFANIAGGVAAAGAAPFVGNEGANDILEDIQNRWTYQPESSLKAMGELSESPVLQDIGEQLEKGRGLAGDRMALPENFLDKIQKSGGASVEAFTGQPATDGFMMAKYPNTNTGANAIMENPTADDIARYLDIHAEELSEPGTYLGGWMNDGKLYLEPSKRFDEYQEAFDFGGATDQLAGFDLNKYPAFDDASSRQSGYRLPKDGMEFDVAPDTKAGHERKLREMIQWLFTTEQRFEQ